MPSSRLIVVLVPVGVMILLGQIPAVAVTLLVVEAFVVLLRDRR